jgi:prevent-host-death family protein
MQEISSSEFKARCLALLDEIAEGGGEMVVTKDGRPLAKVVPADAEASLHGTVTYNVSDEELTGATDVKWGSAARSSRS